VFDVTDQRADRDRRILELMPLVKALAGRYARRGEPLDDLIQVGTIGLIKAVDRFDPTRGVDLASFATPTILGEIRRHFRDRTWMVHVPRGLQESHRTVNQALQELSTKLGRSPSIAELAAHTDLSTDGVLDAIAVGAAYQPMSLSRTPSDDDDESTLDIAADDSGFDQAEARAILSDRVAELPEREQNILLMRFAQGLTQSEIAERVGISQMHVSRLITRALATLRDQVGDH
jgi:RNA polymerase sigma-B factor